VSIRERYRDGVNCDPALLFVSLGATMVSHHVGISGLPGTSFAPVCWFERMPNCRRPCPLPGVS
jgi:hypothetical protein